MQQGSSPPTSWRETDACGVKGREREFSTYELERDKNGNFKGGYPDKDNHTIDACRYALEDEMIRRKARIRSKKAAGLR